VDMLADRSSRRRLAGSGRKVNDSVSHELEPPRITIPYVPRVHFRPLHASLKRWMFLVAHRRAGKTVALCNQVVRKALENPRVFPPPRYGYIGPSFAQAKDLVWGYYKYYTGVLPNVKVVEGDLQIVLPTGAMINLYGGAAAYERMRGLYFDGVVADEYPLLNPSMLGSVIRPCLADYRGWAVISGTSAGDDHFHELKKRAEREPEEWELFDIPVTETDALDPDEVQAMRKDMTADEFAREMMCSFEAPVEGSYYGDVMNEISLDGQITGVPYDPNSLVFTSWDLGIDDEMVIWYMQRCGRELHTIDFTQNTGKGLEYYVGEIKSKPYAYGCHVLPHDIKARELGTGVSRKEVLDSMLPNTFVCPLHRVEDGISATRALIRQMWIDKTKCAAGITALRAYSKGKNGKPVHNWASHAADSMRTGAVAINMISPMIGGSNVIGIGSGALRRNLKRLGNVQSNSGRF
jgi:phage terminase large subunit